MTGANAPQQLTKTKIELNTIKVIKYFWKVLRGHFRCLIIVSKLCVLFHVLCFVVCLLQNKEKRNPVFLFCCCSFGLQMSTTPTLFSESVPLTFFSQKKKRKGKNGRGRGGCQGWALALLCFFFVLTFALQLISAEGQEFVVYVLQFFFFFFFFFCFCLFAQNLFLFCFSTDRKRLPCCLEPSRFGHSANNFCLFVLLLCVFCFRLCCLVLLSLVRSKAMRFGSGENTEKGTKQKNPHSNI